MYTEIERKFLVRQDLILPFLPDTHKDISQGYIFQTDGGLLRVRISNESAFITIKSNNVGGECLEYEYPIPLKDATHMMGTMCSHILRKRRFEIQHEGHLWEVDYFPNSLILAEVELASMDEEVAMPLWVLDEVTGDPAFFNNNILQGMVDFSG